MEARFNPDIHHRQSTRLKGYDYSQAGAYFVTVCSQYRECLFGKVTGGKMKLNDVGQVVQSCWQDIQHHFIYVQLDAFTVMPNHVHGVLVIAYRPNVGARHASPLRNNGPHGVERGSLGAIIGSFKSATTKHINQLRGTPGMRIWQRNYYEHIIRDENDLLQIRQYIESNPAKWEEDENHLAIDPL